MKNRIRKRAINENGNLDLNFSIDSLGDSNMDRNEIKKITHSAMSMIITKGRVMEKVRSRVEMKVCRQCSWCGQWYPIENEKDGYLCDACMKTAGQCDSCGRTMKFEGEVPKAKILLCNDCYQKEQKNWEKVTWYAPAVEENEKLTWTQYLTGRIKKEWTGDMPSPIQLEIKIDKEEGK